MLIKFVLSLFTIFLIDQYIKSIFIEGFRWNGDWLSLILVYNKGEILFNEENEKKAATIMKQKEFKIICDLGISDGSFTAYGCDLGYEYVKINADSNIN